MPVSRSVLSSATPVVVRWVALFSLARSCGSSAVTNTGERSLRFAERFMTIQKTLQMTGLGFIRVLNAGNITLVGTGKLKARGDFVQPAGYIIAGGEISLASSETISHDGILSQYLACPDGRVVTVHPAGLNPVIGTGVTFNPPRLDTVIESGVYEACPSS